MPTRTFTSGRIRKADYDPASRQLDLHWDNQSVLAYQHVPEEVFRRLCSAPNPATYWEDRIAEEYPKATPRGPGGAGGGDKKWGDLFGGGEESLAHITELDRVLRGIQRPTSLREIALPGPLQILVLAPHPDDFDAVGCTLRHLQGQGHALHVAVLTTGASGVDEGFGGAVDTLARTLLREEEQRASCAFFGLPGQRLSFLRMWGGAGADAEADELEPLRHWMGERPADLLFMPHGNDSNRTHRRTWEAVRQVAAQQQLQAWALLNQDAKTLGMRVDLFFDFGEEEAAWKAELLRLHASQQARNLRTRGIGFDERVLQVNGDAAQGLPTGQPYAEAFELMRLG